MTNQEDNKVVSGLRKISTYWRTFPNTTTAGQYCFFTHVVTLNSLSAKDFTAFAAQKSGMEQYQCSSKILPLAAHEYTHWLDGTSSLFGLRLLRRLMVSYPTNPHVGLGPFPNENTYWAVKQVAHSMQHLRFPDYYSVVHQGKRDLPWKQSVTLGHGFDEAGRLNDDAIFFLRLSDLNDHDIARQPISVAAILESRANYQEYECRRNLLAEIENDVERTIEGRRFKEEVMSNLYCADLTLYSAAAHLMASVLGTNEAMAAYAAASALGQFVLQCPRTLLSSFVIEESDGRRIGDREILQRIERAVQRGQIEVLYCYIALTNDWEHLDVFDFQRLIDVISKRYFNCDGAVLQTKACEEYEQLFQQFSLSKYPYAEALESAIRANSALLLNQTGARIDFTNCHLPRCYFGDGAVPPPFFSQINDSSVAAIDPEKLFFALDDHATWVRTFSNACYPMQSLLD